MITDYCFAVIAHIYYKKIHSVLLTPTVCDILNTLGATIEMYVCI